MTDPFIRSIPSVDKRIMPPRTALVPYGPIPAGECLNNWMPSQLVQGAMCFVIGENAMFRFDKFSVSAEVSNTCIATMAGTGVPGRWKAITGSSKSYEAISYAGPNNDGTLSSISCLPLLTDTWTPFDAEVLCIEFASHGYLSWDNDKSIIVGKPMAAQVEWSMSWQAHSNYLWDAAVMLNGAVNYIPGTRTRGYYAGEASANENQVMSASTIANLTTGDTLQLMVRTTGQLSETDLEASFCTLTVTEL
jgi:hypothetical protein